MNIYNLLPLLFFLSATAQANKCTEILSLSKTVQTNIVEKDFFEKRTSDFCKKYNKSRNNSDGFEYDFGYELLSVSAGSSNKNAEHISDNFCSSENRSKLSNDAYKKYVETISPSAHKSYEKCLEFSRVGVNFELNSQTESEFTLSATFLGHHDSKAILTYEDSKGISCNWKKSNEEEISFKFGESRLLRCSRNNIKKDGYVIIQRVNGLKKIDIPWKSQPTPKTLINSIRIKPAKPIKISLPWYKDKSLKNVKFGNNNSVSCQVFCEGPQWGGWSSNTCLGAYDISRNKKITCAGGYAGNSNVACKCFR